MRIYSVKLLPRLALLLIISLASVSHTLAARYSLKDIESQAPGYEPSAINNVGTVVGLNNDTPKRPFVWRVSADPDTKEISYKSENIVLLETNNLCSLENAADCLAANLSFSEIHITAINNEQSYGSGGEITGWYVDDNGNVQSVLWYQKKNLDETLSYKAVTLPPLKETARYCKADIGGNYLTPECIYAGLDDVIINEIRQCADENLNWETDGIVRMGYSCTENRLPICEYSMTKTTIFNTEPDDQNANLNETQIFKYNPDKLAGNCILREHIEIALLAAKCDENNAWVNNAQNESAEVIPITVTCDKQSQAFAINNNKNIFGVSYNASKNIRHPVAWLRSDINKDDGSPLYRAINLGLERVDVTPESVKEYNDSRAQTDPEKSISIQIKRWQGEAQIASTSTGDVAGILKQEETDTVFKPYYWSKVNNSGFEKPMELTSPLKDDKGNYLSFFTPPMLPNAPQLTSIASRQILGWYLDENNLARSIEWQLLPERDKDNQEIDVLRPEFVPMLEAGNLGKVLHANFSREIVGTAKITANNISEDNAFYLTRECGTQDLNQLLDTSLPINDLQRFTEAYRIASGPSPNPILVKGISTDTNTALKNYVLLPTDIYVNLKVDISTNRDRLTVGEEYTYYITLTNNAPNYATCVSLRLVAAVYNTMPDESGFIPEDLPGGLSFLRIESQADISCKTSPVDVECILDKLSPGEPVTIIAVTSPRALLADRQIKATVAVSSTETELPENREDNTAFVITSVDRRGCFIATAAYGSYLSPEVKQLRLFRDEVLLSFTAGRWLVDTYYDISPPLADYISQHESLRAVARWVLSPFVYMILYPLPTSVGILIVFCLCKLGLKTRPRPKKQTSGYR